MKRFVIRLLCAVSLGCLVISLSLVIQIWQGYTTSVEKVFTAPAGAKVLCLGSSHTGCTWEEGDGVYSVWLNGSAFVFSLIRLKEMERLGQLGGVKYCIADADYEGLYGRLRVRHVEETFLQSVHYAWRYVELLPGEGWKYAWAALTWLGHRRDIKSATPRDGNIYKGLTALKKANLLKSAELDLMQSTAVSESIVEANKKTLDEMKRLCDTHDIKLILFAGPLVKGHPLRGAHRDLLNRWITFCRESGVEYWDLRDEMPDEFFYDINHLSDEGRKIISEKYLSRLLLKQ